MDVPSKQDKILDALQELLQTSTIQKISVSDIAEKAGIGKGSIYYYFSSKRDIISALVERNYAKPLETAKQLAAQTHVSPFTRMAMISQACRNSSITITAFKNVETSTESLQEQAYIHQRYLNHLISELKPTLTEIIKQGISNGEIHFDYPEQLAEIVLIVLSVKLGNEIAPSTQEEITQSIKALVALLEKGADIPEGALNYLTTI